MPEDLYEDGKRAYADGDYETAIGLLKRYLSDPPVSATMLPAARKYLGYALFGMRRFPEAAATLELVPESERDEDFYDSLAAVYSNDLAEAAAQETLSRGIAALPDSGHLQYQLGQAHDRSGNLAGALAAYRKALELLATDDIERVFVWHAMGVAYMNMLQYDVAKIHFGNALAAGPTFTTARYNLLTIAKLQLDWDAVREHTAALLLFDHSLVEAPNDWRN